ncbi:MAG TPA: hypothetical protein VNU72_01910 [Puia sp.]|jgi:hypothetical protein|nr:hypothetical protein [Puia sp.]
MKKYGFLFLLIIVIKQGQGQTSSASTQAPASPAGSRRAAFSHWLIGLTVGPAIPVGSFSIRSTQNAEAGYAKTGFAAELSGAYFFNAALGVVLSAARQENAVGNPKDRLIPPAPPTPNYIVYPPPVIIDNQSWKITRVQAGPVFNIALAAHSLSLQIRALAGILKTAQPGFQYSNKSNGYMLASGSGETAAISLPWTFSYQSDIGLNWKMSRHLALIAKAGYTGSTAVIHDPQYEVNGFITGGVLPEKREYSLGTVYAQAGVGVSF